MGQEVVKPQHDTGCKILLVDDHAVFRETLAVGLTQFGLDVVGQAGDSEQCLQQLQDISVDVLVLDLTLPGRGGADLVGQVARAYPDTGILILSAHPADQFIVRLVKEGARGYLHKSCSFEDVVAAIRGVVAGESVMPRDLAELAGRGKSLLHPHEKLSKREYQVMEKLVAGDSATQIANDMSLSVKTVSTYRKRLMDKLDVRSTSELVAYAIKNGLADV